MSTTIIVQGNVTEDALMFYVENYKPYTVIISTWNDNKVVDSMQLPENFCLVKTPVPSISGNQNVNLQIISTNVGLSKVETDFVIKIRGDEYFSNIEYIIETMLEYEDKIICSPIFFRPWSYRSFHISDHLLAGKTSRLRGMFENADMYMRFINTPEIILASSYLHSKYGPDYAKNYTNEQLMNNFFILDIDKLKPYKVVANAFGKIWRDNFIPSEHLSVTSIQEVFTK